MFLKKLQKKILAQLLFIMVMLVLMPLGIVPALRAQAPPARQMVLATMCAPCCRTIRLVIT